MPMCVPQYMHYNKYTIPSWCFKPRWTSNNQVFFWFRLVKKNFDLCQNLINVWLYLLVVLFMAMTSWFTSLSGTLHGWNICITNYVKLVGNVLSLQSYSNITWLLHKHVQTDWMNTEKNLISMARLSLVHVRLLSQHIKCTFLNRCKV